MSVEKVRGIVLREAPIGESNKQLVVLAKGEGRLLLSARGARQGKSKLLAATQAFSYADFLLYQGRGFFSVTQAELLEGFYGLRQDVEKLAYAAYFAELTEKTVPEGMEADDILLLLLRTFTVLSKTDFSPSLAARIFELKFLSFSGFLSETEDLSRDYGLSAAAEKAVDHVLHTEGMRMFGFALSPEAERELAATTSHLIGTHLNVRLHTLDFLKTLTS